MGYKEQMRQWLEKHQDATIDEAWEAGYFQSTENWCNKTR